MPNHRIQRINEAIVRESLKGAEPGVLRVAGVVERTNKYGLFVVNSGGKRFGFTLDKVRRYSGQDPAEIGLKVGDTVALSVRNDRVQSADTKVLAADAFH
jgi:hypothetical protein